MAIHIHDIEEMIRLLKRVKMVFKNYDSLLDTTEAMLLLEDIDKILKRMEEELQYGNQLEYDIDDLRQINPKNLMRFNVAMNKINFLNDGNANKYNTFNKFG